MKKGMCSLQNKSENLDPSYKMDLDFWIGLEEKNKFTPAWIA